MERQRRLARFLWRRRIAQGTGRFPRVDRAPFGTAGSGVGSVRPCSGAGAAPPATPCSSHRRALRRTRTLSMTAPRASVQVVGAQVIAQVSLVAVLPFLTRTYSTTDIGYFQLAMAVAMTAQPLATPSQRVRRAVPSHGLGRAPTCENRPSRFVDRCPGWVLSQRPPCSQPRGARAGRPDGSTDAGRTWVDRDRQRGAHSVRRYRPTRRCATSSEVLLQPLPN